MALIVVTLPASVTQNNTVSGTVTLAYVAPAANTTVNSHLEQHRASDGHSSVTVLAGQTSATFQVTSNT